MIAVVPFLVQGALMMVDEFYCHRSRLLRRWERIGHPIDTAVFLLCLGWLLAVEPTVTARGIFVGLAVFSCVLITKDEWQHRELCTAFENWLHALLFIMHPVVLVCAGWLWWERAPEFQLVVGGALGVCTVYAIYQVTYWNFIWQSKMP